MFDVSVKNKMTIYFIIGIIFIIFLIITSFELKSESRFIIFIFVFLIAFSTYFWINFIVEINNADIFIDETNSIITIRTIFMEKIIFLNELIIKDHVPYPRRLAFIFFTNKNKIVINYTKNNYQIILKILSLIKYKNIYKFIEEVKKRESFYDLI